MGESELIFEFSELQRISFRCVHCKTVVVFDCKSEAAAPDGCPACKTVPPDDIVRRTLNTYRSLYQKVSEERADYAFHIRANPVK